MKIKNEKRPMLVTGASGYIASWVVKYLLEDGYTVHCTVRDKSKTKKLAHLQALQTKHPGKLRLFEADLLKKNSFWEAMQGCEMVIHTASPFKVQGIKDAQKELIEPALEGTRNVLQSVNETASVERVVLTSSVAAVVGDNSDIWKTEHNIFTDKHWNESCSENHKPYSYSKTLAEKEAWKMVESQHRWDLATINPSFVLGPSITNRKDSTSIDFMLSMIDGRFKAGLPKLYNGFVDVREVARAHIQAAILPEAKGRYLLVAGTKSMIEAAGLMREHFGNKYPFPKRNLPKFLMYIFGPLRGFSWSYIKKNVGIPIHFDNSRSKEDLGIQYRPIKDTLVEHLQQLIDEGNV